MKNPFSVRRGVALAAMAALTDVPGLITLCSDGGETLTTVAGPSFYVS
jgi:hypothetical protein